MRLFGFVCVMVGGWAQDLDPVRLASWTSNRFIEGVAVAGNYAYLVSDLDTLAVIDLSNPSNPNRVGEYQNQAPGYGVSIAGNHAFVANVTEGLVAFDITNPANPHPVGSFKTQNRTLAVALRDNLAFILGDSLDGLTILDVSDPRNPRPVGSFFVSVSLRCGVALKGDLCFVGTGGADVEILDVSNLSQPRRLSRFNVGGTVFGPVVQGNYLYLSSGGPTGEGLVVVDVSDPVNPRRVGGYPWGNVRSVTLQNDIAYLGDATGSMLILDVHEPANPRRIGCYSSLGQISNIAVSGRLAFVANLYFGLDVVDVGVEANPRRVGGYPVSSWTGALNVTSNRAFLVSAQGPYGSPSTLSVLDISNPSSPVRSGEYQYSLGTFQFVTSRSNLVFAANGYNWVEILDINIPTNIQSVGHYYLSGSAHAGPLALVGRYALVLDQSAYQLFPSDSLHVVDIANPGLPQKVGGWRASGVVVDIAIAGNMAYIPGGRKPETAPSVNTIYLIDISDPVHPREAGTYDTYGFPQGVSVVGTNLYVASVWDGLEIVDVSNPLNARRIGRCETQGYAQNVAVSGGYAYVGNSWAGLAVIDVSDPSNPRRVGGNSAVAVWNLGVAGDRILASTDRDGLQILNNFLTPIELSPRLDAGAVKLMLRGPAGQSIRVQRTSAPVGNWEDWQTLVVGSGGTELTDSLSPAVNQRFYRAVAP